MSFMRWHLAPVLALFVASGAQAGELDQRRTQINETSGYLRLTGGDAGLGADALDLDRPDPLDSVPLGDLSTVADFHPETDRWTDRNNRIRITIWTGAWVFSNELDIHADVPVGFRINWEVPGFIGIRWDSGMVPWSRMEVKLDKGGGARASSRWMSGTVHNHNLSLGIFNPELSVGGLAFWAGFGGGLWFYNYSEDDVFGENSNIDADFNDVNIGGNIFVELDYEVADVFHIGIGLRQHFILAEHTDEGRFYELNDAEQSKGSGRNDGQFDDLAAVFEITFNISVLF